MGEVCVERVEGRGGSAASPLGRGGREDGGGAEGWELPELDMRELLYTRGYAAVA